LASGRTHDIINLVALPPFLYYLHPSDFIGFTSGYLVGTFFLSPDNDLYHSIPNKRWKFLKFIWKPYVKLFSHRGLSHMPILGIISKLLYIFIVTAVFVLILKLIFHFSFAEGEKFLDSSLENLNFKEIVLNPFSVSFFIGLILAEIVHITTDIFYSKLKRLKLIR
jgi:uncharacterized metal-binding protein